MMAHEPLAHLSNLYRLTLAQAYFNDRKMDRATFSLFTRSYSLTGDFPFLQA
jgi:nicotinic acid phosphoribosyltransferase